ncbi:MAG: metallophosphoesterase [Pseudomonadota bacterium]
MKLIHISDIHINPSPILGDDSIGNFKACLAHVSKYHRDADMVVITGDLTHHGQDQSYAELKMLLNDWDMTTTLMIGNHDDRERFKNFFPHVQTDEMGYVQYTTNIGVREFLFLDTVAEGSHAGHYGSDRQMWLRKQLKAAEKAERSVFLFMHHNPVEVGVPSCDTIGMVEDGEAFRTILKEFQSIIRHIFFGHCHYILSGSVCGIPFSAPRSTSHPCVPDFEPLDRIGIAPLSPSYNVCLLSSEATIIHTIEFLEDDKTQWLEMKPDGWIEDDTPIKD